MPLRIVLRLLQDIFKPRPLRLDWLFAVLRSLSSALTSPMTLRWSIDSEDIESSERSQNMRA
jgi:hypothetical protein